MADEANNNSSLVNSFTGIDVNLSQASSALLSGNLTSAITEGFKAILPMLASFLGNVAGYINGSNRYTQDQFLAPISGNNAFSAYQMRSASDMGAINKNAYLTTYAESLGFTGLPSEMSMYLSKMPGGMDMLNGAIGRAFELAQSETGMSPAFALRKEQFDNRAKAYNTGADKLINRANRMSDIFGEGVNFTNVAQVEQAIIDRFGNVMKDGNDNEAWKALSDEQKAQVQDLLEGPEGAARLNDIRTGAADVNAVLAQQEADEAKEYRTKEKNKLARLITRREREGAVKEGMTPEERERAEAAAQELDRRIAEQEKVVEIAKLGGDRSAVSNMNRFINMDPSTRIFKMATVADMMVNEAAVSDATEDQKAVVAGAITRNELAARENARQMILKAGGVENAKLIASEFATTMSADSIMSGDWRKTIEAGLKATMGSDIDAAAVDDKARSIMAKLGSSNSKMQAAGQQELMLLAEMAGDEDATGVVRSVKALGRATALAGGDQKAAQDLVNMAMSWTGNDSFKNMSNKDFDATDRIVSLAAQTGGPEALAKTMDNVTAALESLGVATRDVTGKQTRLSGVLASSALELKAGLIKNGEMNARDAEIIATEAVRDLAGSEAGQSMAGLVDLAVAGGMSAEDASALSEQLAGKTTEDQLKYLRENGLERVADTWEKSTASERERYASHGMTNVSDKAKDIHRQAAARELFTMEPLAHDAELMLEGKEFNGDTFNQDWFKNTWKALGYDLDNFDNLDAQTQEMIRKSSGLDKAGLGDFVKRSVAHRAGGGNMAINDSMEGEDVVDHLQKVASGAGVPADVTDADSEAAKSIADKSGRAEGLSADEKNMVDAVSEQMAALKQLTTDTSNFFKKIDEVTDPIMEKAGSVVKALADAADLAKDIIGLLGKVQ